MQSLRRLAQPPAHRLFCAPQRLAATSRLPAPPTAFPAVKLRGLDWHADEEEVMGFLEADRADIIDVLMLKQQGRATGRAFVLFKDDQAVQAALAKDKEYLGERYVEVAIARKAEYYRAVCDTVGGSPVYDDRRQGADRYDRGDRFGRQERPNRSERTDVGRREKMAESQYVKLRGLPFQITAEEVAEWFNEDSSLGIPQLTAESVLMLVDGDRPTGIAYVEFATLDDAQKALVKDRQNMGRRYVELFPVKQEEVDSQL